MKRCENRERKIALALKLGLSCDMTQKMLKNAGEPTLYARDRRDSIVIWALHHKKDLQEVNKLLDEYGYKKIEGECVKGLWRSMCKKDLKKRRKNNERKH